MTNTPAAAAEGWRKSSRSAGNGACLEIWPLAAEVGLRDSKDPVPELWFPRPVWEMFLAGVCRGEFDLPGSA